MSGATRGASRVSARHDRNKSIHQAFFLVAFFFVVFLATFFVAFFLATFLVAFFLATFLVAFFVATFLVAFFFATFFLVTFFLATFLVAFFLAAFLAMALSFPCIDSEQSIKRNENSKTASIENWNRRSGIIGLVVEMT